VQLIEESKTEVVILPLSDTEYKIKDYTLFVDKNKVTCHYKSNFERDFYTKQCAILYVLNKIGKSHKRANEVVTLDDEILRFKSDEVVLTSFISRMRATDFNRTEIAEHKLLAVKSKLKQATESIKKYCFLTKYQKRI